MGVAGLLGQEVEGLVVRQPAMVPEGVVDPGRIRHPVQRSERAFLQVDRRDPAVLVVGGVNRHDGPGAATIERHGAEAHVPRFRFGFLLAVPGTGCVFRFVAVLDLRVAICLPLRGGLTLSFPFPRRLAQRRQRIVRDARQDGHVQGDGLRGAAPQQHQGFSRRLGGADLHAHFFQFDHAAPGHVVRHRVPLPLVALAGSLPQNEVFQRRREVGTRDLDVLSEIVG